MQSSAPPKVVSVEVVATQPTEADRAMIAQLGADVRRSLPELAFIVKLQLEIIPPATGQGWALYVGDLRIPKYWEYPGGIYFKILDATFLAEHQRESLRFSQNGRDFVDTGVKLPGPGAPYARRAAGTRRLPLQVDVLSGRGTGVRVHARDARPARRTTARRTARRRKAPKSK
jgi:hypothetical protein